MKKTLSVLIGLAACCASAQVPFTPFPGSGLQPQGDNGYALAIDSLEWIDTGLTNGAVTPVVLPSLGYIWRAGYSQATNAPQSRIFTATMKAPAVAAPVLKGIKTIWEAFSTADTCTLRAFYPGQTNNVWSGTMTAAASETLITTETAITNLTAAASLLWLATITVTAETDAGCWTALPRIEAVWGD
jgi:hypothetical protein